jgi:small ligand-binding sensory domain FIST
VKKLVMSSWSVERGHLPLTSGKMVGALSGAGYRRAASQGCRPETSPATRVGYQEEEIIPEIQRTHYSAVCRIQAEPEQRHDLVLS